MTRTTQSILTAVVTIIAVLSVQTVWHHFHPPVVTRANRQAVQKPLAPDQAVEAKQAARDFFTAMKDENWTDAAKFWPSGPGVNKKFDDVFTAQTKGAVAGLEIVSIGTPYKEAGNGWVMIPYEVQWKGGGSQTNSLRMMKGPSGQWMWGGGF